MPHMIPCALPGCTAMVSPPDTICPVHRVWRQGPAGTDCWLCRKPIKAGEWYRKLSARPLATSTRAARTQAAPVITQPFVHASCEAKAVEEKRKCETPRPVRTWAEGLGSLLAREEA